ncbi:MAG: hypothetical protein WDN44_14150 [Sphingomonas sp.]
MISQSGILPLRNHGMLARRQASRVLTGSPVASRTIRAVIAGSIWGKAATVASSPSPPTSIK